MLISFYIFFRQLGRWSESNDQEPFRDLVLAGVGAGRHVFLARVNGIKVQRSKQGFHTKLFLTPNGGISEFWRFHHKPTIPLRAFLLLYPRLFVFSFVITAGCKAEFRPVKPRLRTD